MSTWSETVAVTGDVREEMVKYVMLIVPHSFEQSVVNRDHSSKLLSF